MALADRQKELFGYLVAGAPQLNLVGWPRRSAFAVVGNATQESRVAPVTVGRKDHGSDGMFQWRLDRLDGPRGLKAWAQGHGLAWDTIKAQAWFFMWEMQVDYAALYAELLEGKKSLATMTANICRVYERPAAAEYTERVNGKTRLEWRIQYAEDMQTLMGGGAAVVPTGPIVVAGGLGMAGVVAQFFLDNPNAALVLIGFAVTMGAGIMKLMFDRAQPVVSTEPPPVLVLAPSYFEQLVLLKNQRQEIDTKIAELIGKFEKEATEIADLKASIRTVTIEHQPLERRVT